jgi:hypothetical protein
MPKEPWFGKTSNEIPYALYVLLNTSGEFEVEVSIFRLVEANYKKTLSDLGYTEVLGVKLSFENGESRGHEEFFKREKEFGMLFISQPKNVLEYEEI